MNRPRKYIVEVDGKGGAIQTRTFSTETAAMEYALQKPVAAVYEVTTSAHCLHFHAPADR